MIEHVVASLKEAESALHNLLANQVAIERIAQAGALLADAFRQGGHVYSCGNGGSMCDAMHFAEELSGRFRRDRKPLGAVAISDGAYLSCTGNDYGFEHVFSRYVEAHGRAGDVLVGISTSGKSANVIRAVEVAKDRGMKILTLTGREGSAVGRLADIDIVTPGGRFADRVQELHIKVIHTLIELVERHLFQEDYQ